VKKNVRKKSQVLRDWDFEEVKKKLPALGESRSLLPCFFLVQRVFFELSQGRNSGRWKQIRGEHAKLRFLN
jgi:hypothetical protein